VAAAVAKRVRVAVDELPDAQRTAVLLAYFEGRTFRQVARLTGVPEGTAKSRLRLGLRRIADRLQSEGLDGEW
jgi:RNA polymerase sigma factor (sigma-70 family)